MDSRSFGARHYRGHRILDAMRSAPTYADAIFNLVNRAREDCDAPFLELGAGQGLWCKKFLLKGEAVDCVEPDLLFQAYLRTLGLFVFNDISEVADESYGFIFSINVIEHIDDIDRCAEQLLRALKPGGRLFIFTPAFNCLWTSLDTEVGHVRRFSAKEIKTVFCRIGFEVERLHYFDSLGVAALLGVRLAECVGVFKYTSNSIGFYDGICFPISQLLDHVLSFFIGKNIAAILVKPK
jgi:SAM-dependent methyltransferase